MALIHYILLAIGLIIITNIRKKNGPSTQKAPFPKGPKPIPYLGNLHQIPLNKAFLAFTSWSRSASTSTAGIVGLRLGPKSRIVVLNKWTQVRDLFDSRGKGVLYSDRPYFSMADYVLPDPGPELHLVFAQYGANWRRERRTIVEFLSERESDSLLSIQDAESTQMMWELLGLRDNGGDDAASLTVYHRYVLRYFGAVILASVFGVRGKDSDAQSRVGRFFLIQDEWAGILTQGQTPPMDIFPWMKHVPDFLTPWKGWRERAETIKTRQRGLYQELLAETEMRVKAGRSTDCFMGKLIINQKAATEAERDKDAYTQLELQYIGGFLMEGGADTTTM